MHVHRICYFAGTSGDWGGSGRVLFTSLRLLDRSRVAPIVLLSGPGSAQSLLDEMQIPYKIWGPLTEPGRPIAYARAVFRSIYWLRRHRVQLVHMNRANDWRPAELLAARLCGIPVVYHFHTVNCDRSPAIRQASAIFAVSSHVAENCCAEGVPVHVVYNCVDAQRFITSVDTMDLHGISAGQVVVSFIGQIRRIKGIQDFVAMATRVQGAHLCFLIVGQCRDQRGLDDAYAEDELLDLIRCDSRIRYLGYQSKIEGIYQASDVIVVPSRWAEPFGLVLIEAAAAGKPVVATRVGGIPEVVVDGESGFLVETGDVPAMADRVQRLVDDSILRVRLGEAARVRACREFTTKPVRVLEECYDHLLQPRGQSAHAIPDAPRSGNANGA